MPLPWKGVDIVIGTPGRIIDLIKRNELPTDFIRFMVLDEFDIMLDMGFIDDVKYILSRLPQNRQTMFFSATIPDEVKHITIKYTNNAVNIDINTGEVAVKTIDNFYSIANGREKFLTLLAYIDSQKPKKSIVFCRTQINAERIYYMLKKVGIQAVLMHGGLSQSRREHSLRLFKTEAEMLIATNVASRGLDIDNVSDIINVDAEDDPKAYVHRVGRTARMGKSGRAFTIFTPSERYLIYEIESYAKIKMKPLEFDLSKYKNQTNEFIEPQRDYGEIAMRRRNFNQNSYSDSRRGFIKSPGSGRNFHDFRRGKFKKRYQRED